MLKRTRETLRNGLRIVSKTTGLGVTLVSRVAALPKTTLSLLLLTLALGASLAFVLQRGPEIQVETKIEYRDRVIEKEVIREVVKWKEKRVVETRPDGTTSVTEEREGSQAASTSASKEREVSAAQETKAVKNQSLSRYSLMVGATIDSKGEEEYVGEVGARLGNLPLFAVVIGNSAPSIGLGLRLEF